MRSRAGAAAVTNVDTSADALALAERNTALNGLDATKLESVHGDVFHVLRRYRDAAARSTSCAGSAEVRRVEGTGRAAARGYKDINLLAFKLLRPGGC
jgi:23S rRNA (cytosine1962-C5)-methyltransferase